MDKRRRSGIFRNFAALPPTHELGEVQGAARADERERRRLRRRDRKVRAAR